MWLFQGMRAGDGEKKSKPFSMRAHELTALVTPVGTKGLRSESEKTCQDGVGRTLCLSSALEIGFFS